MATRIVTMFRSSQSLYSLDEMVNMKCKDIEADKGEVIDIQILAENKATIIYKL